MFILLLLTAVSLFINNTCVCGPYLSPHKVLQMPALIGPAPIDKVMTDTLQLCVKSAVQQKAIFTFLKGKEGGNVKVTGAIFYDELLCVCNLHWYTPPPPRLKSSYPPPFLQHSLFFAVAPSPFSATLGPLLVDDGLKPIIDYFNFTLVFRSLISWRL